MNLNIDIHNAYEWNSAFMVLSLDNFLAFAKELRFPISQDISFVQEESRRYVNSFFEIRKSPMLLPERRKRNLQLMEETVNRFVINIGEESTAQLLKWLDYDDMRGKEHSLGMFWRSELIRKIILTDDIVMPLSEIIPNFTLVTILLKKYHQHIDGMFNTVDFVEMLPRTSWDDIAHRIYLIGEDSVDEAVDLGQSPLDIVHARIYHINIVELVEELNNCSDLETLLSKTDLNQDYVDTILSIVMDDR